jgi:hypothetical protein
MIGPQDEAPKEGAGTFQDAVTVELCDLDRGVCAFTRFVRAAGDPDSSGTAIACVGGKTVATVVDPARIVLETGEPLVRWACRFEHDAVVLEAELEAVSAPIELGEPVAAAAGVHGYEQLCRVRGAIRVGDTRTEIDGVGRRAHEWGEPTPARRRSLYAVAGDRAVTVTAVRPPEAAEHGAELIAGHMVRAESAPEPFETARLSTIYDDAGRPRTAGLELLLPDAEYPRRVSGAAVCHAAADSREPFQAACFRWSFDGEAAQGGYHLVSARVSDT